MNTPTLQPEDVARYLAAHPEFFDQFPHLLTDLRLSHPFDGRAIPIAERQILQLRDKIALLENKLAEFVQFGEENDRTTQKLHLLTLDLAGADDLATLLAMLYRHLDETFGLPQATVRLWQHDPDLDECAACSDAFRQWVNGLDAPQCGTALHPELDAWTTQPEAAQSQAAVPLRHRNTVGVLVLTSPDAQRFYADMGTLYLQRLGEIAAAAIERLQDSAHHHGQPALD